MTALPTRRLEAWRYTDLSPLAAISFAQARAGELPPALPQTGAPRVVFLNGQYSEAASSAPAAYAAAFSPVAETSDLALAQINAQAAQGGLTLEIPAGQDAGALLLVSTASASLPFATHLRHRITLGAGARLTLIDIAEGRGVYWHNPVTEIVLGEGAALSHYRLQQDSLEAFNTATIRARIESNAAYTHFTATIGARLSRTEIHAALAGEGAVAHLSAAQLLAGEQHGDFTSVVAHQAPHGQSRQVVKSVLADLARGVFQGRIEVDRVAQKTDGYQMSRALLLSETAEMDIKPELQIYADDVKCSHGATIGTLDETQLFYLRSRGIPEAQARALLVHAFLEEALEPVQGEARALFDAAMTGWWAAR